MLICFSKKKGKPDVDFYLSALKYMGCDDPLSAVMIGDVSTISMAALNLLQSLCGNNWTEFFF